MVFSQLFIFYNLILVSTLLWFVTLLGRFFYTSEDNIDKRQNFECGFENTSTGDNQVNFKMTIIFSFLIVYEIELLLLLPLTFNILYSTWYLYQVLFIIVAIVYTCIWDIEANTLEYDN